MKKADLLPTLFVVIDVSSRENVVCFLDFQSQKPLASFSVPNNQPSAPWQIELLNSCTSTKTFYLLLLLLNPPRTMKSI